MTNIDRDVDDSDQSFLLAAKIESSPRIDSTQNTDASVDAALDVETKPPMGRTMWYIS